MQFVNRNKLKGAMAERGMTQVDLAQELNLNLANTNLKINGKRKFTEPEMYVLGQLFGTRVFFLE